MNLKFPPFDILARSSHAFQFRITNRSVTRSGFAYCRVMRFPPKEVMRDHRAHPFICRTLIPLVPIAHSPSLALKVTAPAAVASVVSPGGFWGLLRPLLAGGSADRTGPAAEVSAVSLAASGARCGLLVGGRTGRPARQRWHPVVSPVAPGAAAAS